VKSRSSSCGGAEFRLCNGRLDGHVREGSDELLQNTKLKTVTPSVRNDICVLGTGNMGSAVAQALLAAKHPVTVWNRSKQRTLELADRGAHVAQTAAEAVRCSSHVILLFPDAAVTRQILLAPDTRAALQDKAIATAVGMTSKECLALAEDVGAAGGRLSDVQIISMPEAVRRRQAELFIACHPRDKDDWLRIFDTVTLRIHDVGEVGNASNSQLGLAFSAAFLTAAVAYSVAAFEKMRLPIAVIRDVLSVNPDVGIAQASQMVPEMHLRNYDPGGWSVNNMTALMDLLSASAKDLGLQIGPLQAIKDLYARAAEMGYGEFSVAAVHEVLNPSCGQGLS
jgi:3-hydroxyisobutyrate dehydrogenase